MLKYILKLKFYKAGETFSVEVQITAQTLGSLTMTPLYGLSITENTAAVYGHFFTFLHDVIIYKSEKGLKKNLRRFCREKKHSTQ